MQLGDQLKNATVAVTGCCGTVGRELLSQLADYEVANVIGLDQDEAGLFFLDLAYKGDDRFTFRLANIRDFSSLAPHFVGRDLVLHTAALKHVPLCEQSPLEAIHTNVLGTQNVLQAAQEGRVGRVVFTSTDKAVNPTNVMGTSKLMAERLVTAAATESGLRASTTRFGNVLGSSGSVLPIFHRQIRQGGPVTVTDAEMTRFVMSLVDATALVLQSAFLGNPGDVLITKMPVARIIDLAHVMIEALAPRYGHNPDDISVSIVGPRPGEKRYEELMNVEEVRRSSDRGDFLVIRPALGVVRELDHSYPRPDRPYNSEHETSLSRDELSKFLLSNKLLETAES